jgi:hypothetical protein
VAFWYAIHHSKGFPLGPIAFVRGAAVGDVFPLWALAGLYFLQNGRYILVVQLFPFQSGRIQANCGYSRSSSYLFDVCSRVGFVAVGTLFSAWSSSSDIGIIVFSALTVLESEVVFL